MSTALQFYSNENAQIKGSIIAPWALALIAVCLRCTARRLSKAGFWYDDWLMVPAILGATALSFTSAFWMTKQGLGQDEIFYSAIDLVPLFKGVFISEICWTFVIWIVKYSILAFYWRLFSANRRSIRNIVWVFAAAVTIWGILVLLLTVFQCVPISYIWNLNQSGFCHSFSNAIYVGSSTPHVATDVVLLAFPVPLIWNLHMHRSQKTLLTGVFALGGLVTIISVVRLTYLIKIFRGEFQDNLYTPTIVWTSVEVNTSIICACVPSLGPIVSYVSKQIHRLRKQKSTHKRGTQLLMDMLPAGRPASLPVPPLSRKPSWGDGPNPMLDSSAILEVEARNPQAPELDAEAPGPHILEFETLEPVLEMES